MKRHALLFIAVCLSNALAFGQVSPQPPPPVLSAKLIPLSDTIVPGTPLPLGVEIEISSPWHVYDAILVDTGAPTRIDFEAPAGVRFGPLRFPTPKLGGLGPADFRIEYLEHTGRFTVLTEVTLDPDAKLSGDVKITAKIDALACVEACVPVDTTAATTLKIADQPDEAKNAEALEKARGKQPVDLASAKFIKGAKVTASKERVGVGEAFELLVELPVEPGYHVLDREPGIEDLIPTRVFVESRNGLEIAEEDKQVWPEAKPREVPGLGKLREHAGTLTVRIPAKIADPALPSGPIELAVLVQYQVCSDAGQCFPPQMARGFVRFTADTPTPAPAAARSASPTPTGTTPTAQAEPGAADAELTPRTTAAGTGLLWAVVFAFLGGLILNVMPCVLPVIAIKIAGFVEQAHHDPKRVFRLGLAFGAGVMVYFWIWAAIAGLGSLQLRSYFQNPLQTPWIVLGIGSVIHLMALNMFGVFEITLPGSAAGKLDEASQHEGYLGAFAKGLLATLLGTACSAPFLAVGLAYAVTQPFTIGLVIFSAAGLGLALPYVLLCANPQWLRFVPKPGKWMITFKQAMGFVLLATAVWLLWVLRKQWQADGLVAVIAFWTSLGMAAWVIGKITPNWSGPAAATAWLTALLIVASGAWVSFTQVFDPIAYARAREQAALNGGESHTTDKKDLDSLVQRVRQSDWSKIPWVEYQPGLAAELSRRGYAVYVDYTADWCATCKTNLATSLDIESTRALMKELGVIPIEADFTANDPAIRRDIEADGQLSVPVNRVYAPESPDKYQLLPLLLTPSAVQDALRAAGPSKA